MIKIALLESIKNLDLDKKFLFEGKFYLDARNIVKHFITKEVIPSLNDALSSSNRFDTEDEKKKLLFRILRILTLYSEISDKPEILQILKKYKVKSIKFHFVPSKHEDISGLFQPNSKGIQIEIPITDSVRSIQDFIKFLSKKYSEICLILLHELVHARQYFNNTFVNNKTKTKQDHSTDSITEIDLNLKIVVQKACNNPRFDSRNFNYFLNTDPNLLNLIGSFLRNYLSSVEIEAYARQFHKKGQKEKIKISDVLKQIKSKITNGHRSLIVAFPPHLQSSIAIFVEETLMIFVKNLQEYILQNFPRTLIKENNDQSNFVFHCTHLGKIDGIQADGLIAGSGGNFGGGYQGHSTGRLFLSDAKGAYFWHSKMEDIAHHNSDWNDEQSFEWLPVVLRIHKDVFSEEDFEIDHIGSRDSMADSWFVSNGHVESEDIEIFVPVRGWKPLDRVDPETIAEIVKSQSEFIRDDDEETTEEDFYEEPSGYWEINFDLTLPPELQL